MVSLQININNELTLLDREQREAIISKSIIGDMNTGKDTKAVGVAMRPFRIQWCKLHNLKTLMSRTPS